MDVISGKFSEHSVSFIFHVHCSSFKWIFKFKCYLLDSKADAVQYLKKSRSILPAVYNSQRSGGRTTEETMLLTANEYNNALGSGFTSMNQRFVVKTEKFCDEISNLRNRIVDLNMGGIDGLDDSDIEFLQDEVDDDEVDSDVEFEILFPPPQTIFVKLEDNSEANASNDNNESNDNNQSGSMQNISFDELAEPSLVSSTAEEPSTTSIDENDNSGERNAKENDVANDQPNIFSGTMAFNLTEVEDFFYPEYNVGLRAALVNFLTAWNSSFPFNSEIYDKRFVGILLKEVFEKKYTDATLDDPRILFIKRLFEIRVSDDNDRKSSFDVIVGNRVDEAKNKQNQNRLS